MNCIIRTFLLLPACVYDTRDVEKLLVGSLRLRLIRETVGQLAFYSNILNENEIEAVPITGFYHSNAYVVT